MKKKLTTLFGHVTSRTTGEPRIWELYARLYGDGIGENEQENEKAIQFLHKAVRSESHASGWEKDGTNIKNIRENCSKLANGKNAILARNRTNYSKFLILPSNKLKIDFHEIFFS